MELHELIERETSTHASLRLRRLITAQGQETEYVTLSNTTLSILHHATSALSTALSSPHPARAQTTPQVIAAVNGLAHGGGCEITINSDLVLASRHSTFALPEVRLGVVALAGALPRLVRTVGKQRAMEMALTGRVVTAQEAMSWGLVNEVTEEGGVVERAVEWARVVAGNSPDSVVVSREGVGLGWEGGGVEEGSRRLVEGGWRAVEGGENMREGVRAWVERRGARWVDSKL